VPVQASAQHTPCWHCPDAHSDGVVQAAPLLRLPHMVPLHTLPAVQSAVAPQLERQAPAVPQV
jgi:hypothetical protein